jgi:hypothetical protein
LSIASRAWGTLIWLLFFIINSLLLLSWKGTLSEESIFSFRRHSFAEKGRKTPVSFRKAVQKKVILTFPDKNRNPFDFH